VHLVMNSHAFQTGEREAVLRRPASDLPKIHSGHSTEVLGFAASLCTAGSWGRERQQGSCPDRLLLEPVQCRLCPKRQILAWLLRWEEETAD